jgi:hypothetical protein
LVLTLTVILATKMQQKMQRYRYWPLLALMLLSAPAYAYIDPNSGGLLFQLLTPIFVVIAAGFTFAKRLVKRAWAGVAVRIRAPWMRLSRSAAPVDNMGATDK